MEREHFIQIAAQALGLSPEAVRESLHRLPKQAVVSDTPKVTATTVSHKRTTVEVRAEQLLAVFHAYAGTPLAEQVKAGYCQITGAELSSSTVPPESALFYAEQVFGDKPTVESVDELLRAFESAVTREAYQTAVANLRRAEATGDASLIESAQAACATISLRLAALK